MGNFTDAFKAVFATTKTTATYLPIVTSAGAPDGIISASNFSKVISGNNFGRNAQRISQNEDLDDYTTPGSYCILNSEVAATIAHNPYTGGGSQLFVFTTYTNGSYVVQIYVSMNKNCARRKYTGSFQNWITITDFSS